MFDWMHRVVVAGIVMAVALGCSDSSVVGTGVDAATDAVVVDVPAMDVPAMDVLRCGPGQTECNGACASTGIDPANCGACGRRCGDVERCVGGQCLSACPMPQVLCAGGGDAGAPRCVLTATDREHCGACGRACAAGEVCSEGACTTSCAEPLTTCTDDRGQRLCADLRRDPLHCGACGRGCAPGQTCESSRCVVTCAPGFTACASGLDAGAGFCADLQVDRNHCGACGMACAAGQVCNNGMCVVSCGAGLTDCTGTCRDLQSDRAHCGACGMACASGQVCAAGRCELSCPAGSTRCGERCVVTATDPAHCGACDNACPAAANGTAVCAAGRCGYLCAEGFGDCNAMAGDGCETRLGSVCAVGVGACVRDGVLACVGGAARCVGTPGVPGMETCNNMDDDCDGTVDENVTQPCYGGPAGTQGVGACRAGMQTCAGGMFGACMGEVRPTAEVCDNVDNDCNGSVDNGLTRTCYTGAAGTAGTGACRSGTQTCAAGSWGTACPGEVVPTAEVCLNMMDENCNGMADEGCQGNGSSCRSPIIVTATTTFARNTCTDATDNGSDTTCGTTGSPEHVYLVRVTRASTVRITVTGFPMGGNEGDILYRGTSCPGTPVACTEHNTDLTRTLAAGDHYFLIEDDHAACQAYSVTFDIR